MGNKKDKVVVCFTFNNYRPTVMGPFILPVGLLEPWFMVIFVLYVIAVVWLIYDKIKEKGLTGFVEEAIELIVNFIAKIVESILRSD